jgi:capsular exopolysaccharide synthesis family protein
MPKEEKNLALRPADSAPGIPTMVERIAYYQAPPAPEAESGQGGIPFAHYRWMLNRHKWRLLLFVGIAVAATVLVSKRLTPFYESTVTLDVDRLAPQGVVGQEAIASRSAYNDSELFLATQMKLIQSDAVIRPVVNKYLVPPGGMNPGRSEAPVSLGLLTVTRPARTYLLQISYRSPNPKLAADVANAVAESYINHSQEMRLQDTTRQQKFMNHSIEELQARMEQSAAALAQFEKDLDVVNPEDKTNILSQRMLQLNTDWTNAQTAVFKKAAAAQSVHSGSVEALEASGQGEQLRKLEEQMADQAEKFATVKTHYGVDHPVYKQEATRQAQLTERYEALKKAIVERVDAEYREAQDNEKQLHEAVNETKAQFDQLSTKSLEYKSLKRDADQDKAIYDELNKKVKEAGINQSFQSSSIRIADIARPALNPVYPRIMFNALVAFFTSSLLGIVIVFVAEGMDHTLRDPEEIQRQLQTEVLGALPVVKAWRGHLPSPEPGGKRRAFFGGSGGVANTYEEAVRTLRDSILLPNGDRRPKSLLITSATPREGKTTTAVHLAVVHSQQKRKTLLIDSDLRRPGVYQHAGISNDKGFSNVVNGEAEWRDLLQTPEGLPHLNVLAAGPPSRRAADGVGDVLKRLIAEAGDEYDLIICDAPPLLGFAESLQIAALVDGVVVVALAGQTERTAVASVLQSLKRLKANVIGLALNEVRSDMSERYYYYGYYGKYYSRYYKALSN